MKVNFGINFFLKIVLAYPILLGLLFFFKIQPFFITAPYFFIVLLLLSVNIGINDNLIFKKSNSLNIILTLILFGISVLNYSTVRYSLVILFSFYVMIFHLFVIVLSKNSVCINEKVVFKFFICYLLLSVTFLFLDQGHMEIGNRFVGFTASPTTFSGILVVVFILVDVTLKPLSRTRLILLFIVLLFVYLSKTRLILLFLIVYPFLVFFIKKKAVSLGLVFLVVFTTLFFVYALYGWVIERFPELVTLRYEDARDASFGLRYQMYKVVELDFYSGTIWEILFGKGNEYSRLLIIENMGKDFFPHNDFIRIINDWGIVGASAFFIFLYRISKKNITGLLVSLLYLILWYSNMIFNLFLISILIIASFQLVSKENLELNRS